MEAIGKACSNGLDVTEAHCQLVSLISTLEVDKWIEKFDWKNDKYPVYKKARMYMKQVSDLLQFLRGTRDHNWLLHLSSLEKNVSTFNRHDYTQITYCVN